MAGATTIGSTGSWKVRDGNWCTGQEKSLQNAQWGCASLFAPLQLLLPSKYADRQLLLVKQLKSGRAARVVAEEPHFVGELTGQPLRVPRQGQARGRPDEAMNFEQWLSQRESYSAGPRRDMASRVEIAQLRTSGMTGRNGTQNYDGDDDIATEEAARTLMRTTKSDDVMKLLIAAWNVGIVVSWRGTGKRRGGGEGV